MSQVDLNIYNYFLNKGSLIAVKFFYILTGFFDEINFFILALLFVFFIYKNRGAIYAFMFSASLVFGAGAVWVLKHLFNTVRPPIQYIVEVSGGSFPSGHTTFATIFFLMIAFIFGMNMERYRKFFLNFFCAVMIILVGFSRVYLGAHWLSDVLGGLALGVVIYYISIKVFYMIKYEKLKVN